MPFDPSITLFHNPTRLIRRFALPQFAFKQEGRARLPPSKDYTVTMVATLRFEPTLHN